MFSAQINFNSQETGKRVSRTFSSNDPDTFLKWMNTYLKMPNVMEVDLTLENVSDEALKTFRWPNKLRKRIVG